MIAGLAGSVSTVQIVAAAAVLIALGVGAVLFVRTRRPNRIGSPEDAAAACEATLQGFNVTGAVVGADGGGALAVSGDGRVAAVKRLGRGLVAREVMWRTVRSTADGILVETGDRQLGEVRLAGVNVLDIRRLAPRHVAL